jgi:tRNA-dihydrouridine synthase
MKNFWKKFKKPILALAPMAGITDSAFRLLCKNFGADVVYSEMTSVDGLYYKGKKTMAMLEFNKKEQPFVVQLFGKKPELFSKAAKIVESSGAAGIDINFGCPARKVVAHGGGVTLMRDLNLCYELIQATVEAVEIPVSVKIRTAINLNRTTPSPSLKRRGNDDGRTTPLIRGARGVKKVTALNFVKKIRDLPVAAVMVHGRSYEQGFKGDINDIDFKMIKEVKKRFKGIVLANGRINSPEDAKILLNKTGADGVGLARGLYGKPWLFKQIKDYLTTGQYSKPNFSEIKKIALKHAKLLYKTKGKKGMFEIRKHLAWYIKGFEGASEMRKKLMLVKSVYEIEKTLNLFKFSHPKDPG